MTSLVHEAPTRALIPSLLMENAQAVGASWIISSALFTTYSTTRYLKYPSKSDSPRSILPRATQLTLYRFLGSLCLGLLVHPNLRILERVRETVRLLPSFSIPAIFLFIANYANSISLKRIGISLTYTTKCAIPIITLLLTLLMDGKDALPRLPAMLSLIPIALGIAAASWDHPTFEPVGLIAAFISCTAQGLLNILSKRVMTKINVPGAVAQRAMISVGLVITLLVSVAQFTTATNSEEAVEGEEHPPTLLTTGAATAYHFEYLLSFTFVKLVAPITFSTCDAIRRLGIIITGHYMFGGHPFSATNIFGIGMALSGAVAYAMLNH